MLKSSDLSTRLSRSLLLAAICNCSNQGGSNAALNGAAGDASTVGGNEAGGGSSAAGNTSNAGAGGPQGGAGGASGGDSAGGLAGGSVQVGGALPDGGAAGSADSGGGLAGGSAQAGGAPPDGGAAGSADSGSAKSVVTRTVAPNRFVNLGSGHYFIEFPASAFGTVDITITATNSASVSLKFGEKKSGDAVNTTPGGDVTYKIETLAVTSGTRTYRITQHPTLGFFARPDKLFATIPFRYVEVSGCPGALAASDINQIAVNYPFDDTASAFTSSSGTLDAVWSLCKYSTKACSWLGVYVDGNRERCPYEADAYIQMLSHYCQDTQAYGIGRNSLTDLLAHPSWPAEWAFNFIYAAWADYLWTGDVSFLATHYAAIKTKTLEKYARSDGLINPTGTGLAQDTPVVDWPYQYRDGYDLGAYPSSVNAQYYQALVLVAKMASVLGNTSDAASYSNKAKTVYDSFQAAYYNSGQGTYVDSVGSTHYALHASAYPLACDVVPSDKIASVASHAKARGAAFGVYGAQYVIEGLYKAGEEDYALSLLASTGASSWYNMIASGSTMTTEAFDTAFGDWSHAWGTAPANLIPRCLMGIEPIGAGFSKIQIKPQIGTLSNASVTVPTIRGSVSVSVTKGSTYKIAVTVPFGAAAKVYVKDYGSLGTSVTVDGASTSGTMEGNYVVFDNVSAGSHAFEKAMGAQTP
jgi:alpha-L-rhamnosidase